MADRVTWLTTQEPGTEVSGCNGFCFAYRYTTPTPSQPIVVPRSDCKKWYSRVKNWHLDTDAEVVDSDGNSWALGDADLGPGIDNPTTESQLVDFLKPRIFGNVDQSEAVMSLSLMEPPNYIYRDTSLHPTIVMEAAVGPDISKGQLLISANSTSAHDGTITGMIDGYDLTLYYALVAPAMSFTLSSFVLTPVEYWPYAAKNGSPIYNTTTGAELQDPRN